MNLDLTGNAAYADRTPYEVWQETEGVPIYKGLAIDDLTTATVAPWKRKGASGAFINLLGAGRSCDSYLCEIPAQRQTLPERYLFEELIYVVKGRGATSVWSDNGRKQSFEWQPGSMFSPPLNTWRQHFNAEAGRAGQVRRADGCAGDDQPVPQPGFYFQQFVRIADRFSGEEGFFSGKGRVVESHRTWDSNFIADVPTSISIRAKSRRAISRSSPGDLLIRSKIW